MSIPKQVLPPLHEFPASPDVARLHALCERCLVHAKESQQTASLAIRARRDDGSPLALALAQVRPKLAAWNKDTALGALRGLAKITRETDPQADAGPFASWLAWVDERTN